MRRCVPKTWVQHRKAMCSLMVGTSLSKDFSSELPLCVVNQRSRCDRQMHGQQAGNTVWPIAAVCRKNDKLWCNCACGGRTSMGQLASRGGGSMSSDNGNQHALWQFEKGRLVLRSCTCEAGRPRGRLQQSRCRVSLERVTLGR